MALAQVTEDGLNDGNAAIELYRQAQALNPQNAEIIDRLARLYERAGQVPDLVTMLEQQAQSTPDKTRAAALYNKIGDLQGGKLRQNDAA